MPEAMLWVLLWCFVWPAFWGTGRYLRARQRLAAMQAQVALAPPATPQPDPAAEQELQALRERVKVLERIVVDANMTDARHTGTLAGDIEALR